MPSRVITINRAPVLALWAAVVAQRLGFNEDEALTRGKAVAALNAVSIGQHLGIFKPHEQKPKEAREKERGERFSIDIMHRAVPAVNTEDGVRAVQGGKPINPDRVRRYLAGKVSSKAIPGACIGKSPTQSAIHMPKSKLHIRLVAPRKGRGVYVSLSVGPAPPLLMPGDMYRDVPDDPAPAVSRSRRTAVSRPRRAGRLGTGDVSVLKV